MILSDIRNYLRERGQASLSDLALHFDSEPDAVRGMLAIWLRKGRVRSFRLGQSCGGCTQCDPAANEVYQWVGDGDADSPPSSPCNAAQAISFHATDNSG